MKFTVTVSVGLVGCTVEREFEIDDEELADMNAQERDGYIEEAAQDAMFQMIEWNFKESKQ